MSEITREIEGKYRLFANDQPDDVERRFAILTCMDPRIIPDAINDSPNVYIIRNAGGRATDDAIRSLIISHKLLHTNEWAVIQHTDCGMEKFDNNVMGCLLEH